MTTPSSKVVEGKRHEMFKPDCDRGIGLAAYRRVWFSATVHDIARMPSQLMRKVERDDLLQLDFRTACFGCTR